MIVKPVGPFQDRIFNVIDTSPRAAFVDDLRFVKPIDGLGQDVIVGVTSAAHGGFRSRFSEPLRVADRQVLASPVAVVNRSLCATTLPQRMLQCIHDKVRVHRGGYAAADNTAREDISEEGNMLYLVQRYILLNLLTEVS